MLGKPKEAAMNAENARELGQARQTEILIQIKEDPDAYFSSVRRSDFGFQPPEKKSNSN